METESRIVLKQLEDLTTEVMEQALRFESCSPEVLSHKPRPDAWSILECLEHLNRYSAFYLPEIKKALEFPAKGNSFKSGLIGNYLVNAVIPKENGRKMKTFAEMNSNGTSLSPKVVTDFLFNHKQLLGYIQKAKLAELNKAIVPVTFSRWIKLRLGDALRFMAYHNQRHILQALRNLESFKQN